MDITTEKGPLVLVRMPVVFLSHGGGPWPYIESMKGHYAKTERELRRLPERLPAKPQAVLVISGHWEAAEFTLATARHPAMVYDYAGFPAHAYQINYPAPGAPALAERVAALLEQAGIVVRHDQHRGFDHGTFVPLGLMFPDADVPVLMLSLKSSYDAQEHIRVGRALQALRGEGVLILGSGLTYHNMRGFGRDESTSIAVAFERYLSEAIGQSDSRARDDMLLNWQAAPGARLAHPQEDHLLPLMVVAGAAGDDIGWSLILEHVLKVPMASYAFGDVNA